jgi:hypothetical protein
VRFEAFCHTLADAIDARQRFQGTERTASFTTLHDARGERWTDPGQAFYGFEARGIEIDRLTCFDLTRRL